ncbi:integrin alpha-4 [Bicyclus anynana]|uniref:Integrin alpha-4 n=1 Tax=Bicyclus anynana TaxID=110368 RepID=A0A6J1MWG4_BICAN|nr:integrin alpha-4 [Bicyclus anynana]
MFILSFWYFWILESMVMTRAFIDEKSGQIVPRPPDLQDNAFFGYSMAYQSESSSLLVSAPQQMREGKIFNMNMTSGIVKDESSFHDKLKAGALKYDYWLGAAVAVGPDYYVSCSPRYAEMIRLKNKPNVKLPGSLSLCFINRNNSLQRLRPLSDEQRKKYTTKRSERMDSFGWSIHVAPNQKDVLIGGAAMYKGRVILYDNILDIKEPKLIRRINEDNPVKYNFGYSITSGNFFSDKATVYAISTTYGEMGYGKVYFFDTKLNHIDSINDDNLGSMFGAALCSAILRDPVLLVGAPAYADNKHNYDVGAVYIYAAASGSNRMKLKRIIKGSTSGGFFGHSIVSLGDMDDDGNDEIAIAAPYEDDGKGAVYIYSGVGILDGKLKKRIQYKNVNSFGYSLAVLRSATENNGLAIGAIEDNTIVMYKGIASITVDLYGFIDKTTKNEIQTEIEIKPCVHITYPKKPVEVIADLKIMIKVTDQFCRLNKDSIPYTIQVRGRNDTQFCLENIKANCPAETKSKLKISYELTAFLSEEHGPSKVLLSERSRLSFQADEYWPCEVDNCRAKLKAEINSSIPQPYVVGSSNAEEVSLKVLNSGDTAYSSCAEVIVQNAHVSRLPPDCTIRAASDTLLCKPKRPILKDHEWMIGSLSLEPRQDLKSMQEYDMTVKCVIYYDCNIPKDNETSIAKYKLIGDTKNIHIKGQSNPEGDVDVTPGILLTEGKSFEHLYSIENKGTTNWNGMQIQIILEYVPYIGYSEVPIKIYTAASYIECPIEKTQIDNRITATCDVGDLLRSEKTSVIISMNIIPNTLELDENKPNVTVTTTLNVLGIQKSLSQQTLVKLQVANVPTWVIALATIIGLVLVSLIAFALYHFGFLKRKNKKRLTALKADVYRQSVRRSMIRDSMRAVARRKSTDDLPFLPTAEEDCPEREMTIDEKLQRE